MKRIFLGVPLSLEVASNVAPLVLELKQTGGEFTFVSFENLHFTIKFLGKFNEETLLLVKEKLSKLVSSVRKFSVTVNAVGIFPSLDRIRAVWVGSESREFVSLIKNVNAVLRFVGKENYETIIPHATIARVKSGKNTLKIQEFVERNRSDNFGSMVIDTLVLYESTLTPMGPLYTVREKFSLT